MEANASLRSKASSPSRHKLNRHNKKPITKQFSSWLLNDLIFIISCAKVVTSIKVSKRFYIFCNYKGKRGVIDLSKLDETSVICVLSVDYNTAG